MLRQPLTRVILPVNQSWDPDQFVEELEGSIFYDCGFNFCCSVNEDGQSLPCDGRTLAAEVAGAAAVIGAVVYLRNRKRAAGKR